MESDEALARALQASMGGGGSTSRAPAKTQEELDRLMALQLSQGIEEQQQQQQGGGERQRGGSSNNCSLS